MTQQILEVPGDVRLTLIKSTLNLTYTGLSYWNYEEVTNTTVLRVIFGLRNITPFDIDEVKTVLSPSHIVGGHTSTLHLLFKRLKKGEAIVCTAHSYTAALSKEIANKLSTSGLTLREYKNIKRGLYLVQFPTFSDWREYHRNSITDTYFTKVYYQCL